ncbi:3-isopropylmalate dehydratase large subunit [Aliihoeflea aestuarii]|jgi:3-isopropylmalate/(R)-2-methylmalate dehydratase large subunit|uniref:3-isopropylmalate dehydratase large subunit n=1 Tax=Aliihoeflea aestuarii TaxID=453840 RepID=UPI0020956D09|nr:3-isopropylmalate dehydratase large subunit [Aliihoeflea aestuarii]MCO6392670.1 3-isopropylmalate dehydratase large subunit [Aliihoeflea aestuarii]
MTTGQPRTLFAKVWDAHVIGTDGDQNLLWIDRHFVHEGSFHAFGKLKESGRPVRHPELTFGVADHYVPSDHSAPPKDTEVANMIDLLTRNTTAHGIDIFAMGDSRQGIVHVAAPEQGLSLPGLTIVCGDSHTATHGAFGAFAFGIGASEVAHVLATQTLWQKRPKIMRITVDGVLGEMTSAKDLALYIISRIGTGGATGHVVEYDGSAIRALSMEGRMTLCNMTIEAGARAGMVAPDETTVAWLEGRPLAPKGADLDAAKAFWAKLRTDAGAAFDKEMRFDAADVGPMVTWGTSPEEVAGIAAHVPVAEDFQASRDYMGLEAGQEIAGIEVDQVFIGSCTNSRLQDLREAASVLKLGKVAVPTMIVPGSAAVKKMAEAEGLNRIFRDAGAQWRDSGCSMCVAMNGDAVAPGKRCASTSNRNFPGRQGRGARTHLMSPAMAAAAALTGRIVDVRTISAKPDTGAGQ